MPSIASQRLTPSLATTPFAQPTATAVLTTAPLARKAFRHDCTFWSNSSPKSKGRPRFFIGSSTSSSQSLLLFSSNRYSFLNLRTVVFLNHILHISLKNDE